MIFLQKKRDSKRNLFLKIKNIICYYQTEFPVVDSIRASNFKTSYVITKLLNGRFFFCLFCISKHHMLLPNSSSRALRAWYVKISKHHMLLPNVPFLLPVVAVNLISKHHMLLPNLREMGVERPDPKFQNIICYYQTLNLSCLDCTERIFQNIICYYQTHGFKPSFNPLIPWKPLNHGILFKFYQPTPNFRNDS